FNSSVHKWNTVNVGPKRDLVGEFAEASRHNGLKWVATAHTAREQSYMASAFGADKTGPRKGEQYDGRLTLADGKGKWWGGLDPQQLYATHYPAFEAEVRQRHIELVNNYRPKRCALSSAKWICKAYTSETLPRSIVNHSLALPVAVLHQVLISSSLMFVASLFCVRSQMSPYKSKGVLYSGRVEDTST
ncbi:hypothetical protein EZS27_043315, partial [termite gut metagenome]